MADLAGPTEMVAGTVQVEGVITDADSGRPVPGAVVLVFKPGVSASEWGAGSERSLDDIFTAGESDRNGRYRLLRRLERSVQYEVAADHPEYPLMTGVFDCADTPEDHTVDIELSR